MSDASPHRVALAVLALEVLVALLAEVGAVARVDVAREPLAAIPVLGRHRGHIAALAEPDRVQGLVEERPVALLHATLLRGETGDRVPVHDVASLLALHPDVARRGRRRRSGGREGEEDGTVVETHSRMRCSV